MQELVAGVFRRNAIHIARPLTGYAAPLPPGTPAGANWSGWGFSGARGSGRNLLQPLTPAAGIGRSSGVGARRAHTAVIQVSNVVSEYLDGHGKGKGLPIQDESDGDFSRPPALSERSGRRAGWDPAALFQGSNSGQFPVKVTAWPARGSFTMTNGNPPSNRGGPVSPLRTLRPPPVTAAAPTTQPCRFLDDCEDMPVELTSDNVGRGKDALAARNQLPLPSLEVYSTKGSLTARIRRRSSYTNFTMTGAVPSLSARGPGMTSRVRPARLLLDATPQLGGRVGGGDYGVQHQLSPISVRVAPVPRPPVAALASPVGAVAPDSPIRYSHLLKGARGLRNRTLRPSSEF